MTIESKIVEHYGASELLAAIEAGIEALGKTTATVTVVDLGPVDEFHIGGRGATSTLCDRLQIGADDTVVDIGCGIGGTARLLASTLGCKVTGIDLVPGYIDVARELTRWTGLSDVINYKVGSGLDLPLPDNSFDAATQLHVGMNIEDKDQLFTEIHRVLRPGAMFGLYDVMQTAQGELSFPVPWAADASTSFLADISAYEAALASAGFEILEVINRSEFALEFFDAVKKRNAERSGPPSLGLHTIIGSAAPIKLANMISSIAGGIVAPVEIICRCN